MDDHGAEQDRRIRSVRAPVPFQTYGRTQTRPDRPSRRQDHCRDRKGTRVEAIITGSVLKFGNVISVTAKLIDVVTAKSSARPTSRSTTSMRSRRKSTGWPANWFPEPAHIREGHPAQPVFLIIKELLNKPEQDIFLTYRQATDYLFDRRRSEMKTRTGYHHRPHGRLGNPQKDLRCVHVAGTNGKGSTSAILESILRRAGYSTGCTLPPISWTCGNGSGRTAGRSPNRP